MGVYHDSGATEATGMAAWMMATLMLLVVGIVLFIALLAWSPWNDGGSSSGPSDQSAPEQQGDGTDVDIQGDIDVNDGQPDQTPSGQ